MLVSYAFFLFNASSATVFNNKDMVQHLISFLTYSALLCFNLPRRFLVALTLAVLSSLLALASRKACRFSSMSNVSRNL